MDTTELTATIRARFTPWAFTCDCKGAEQSCADALQNPYLYGVVDTINNIIKLIESQTQE